MHTDPIHEATKPHDLQLDHEDPDNHSKARRSSALFLRTAFLFPEGHREKLFIVDQILGRMKALGLNRHQLAARMKISPTRVTTMMDGTDNFTIKTLMRAADAVEGELILTLAPKT